MPITAGEGRHNQEHFIFTSAETRCRGWEEGKNLALRRHGPEPRVCMVG